MQLFSTFHLIAFDSTLLEAHHHWNFTCGFSDRTEIKTATIWSTFGHKVRSNIKVYTAMVGRHLKYKIASW